MTFFGMKQDLQKSNSESSDSLDSLFDDKEPCGPEIATPTVVQPKEVTYLLP